MRRRLPVTLQDMFLVPEEFELPPISLVSYIELNSKFYPRFSKEDMVKYLHFFEMDMDADLGALSMGQKKKIFMSFALATNTSLLLMDEPTNGLDIPGKKVLFNLYIILMLMPFQVTMLSQYIVLNSLNMINTHWAIILPLMFSTFPIFIMYSAFEQVPDSVVEAARLDGAGSFRIFIYMAVPIAKRGIIAAVILGFLEYWNVVEQPVVFLKDKYLWPLSVYLPNVTEGSAGRAFTFALFSCVPSLIVFYVGRVILAEGISIGSAED